MLARTSETAASLVTHASPRRGNSGAQVEARAPGLITADAGKVSPRSFMEALGLTSPEMREVRRLRSQRACIGAIFNGDTYGFPPSLVEECKAIIAEQGLTKMPGERWRVEL